ncbi:MAG TPA: hypothetical protein VMV69_04190 [Pirellulales bacterium]|nr:hypothetical protein [Pirellulales bacterium]
MLTVEAVGTVEAAQDGTTAEAKARAGRQAAQRRVVVGTRVVGRPRRPSAVPRPPSSLRQATLGAAAIRGTIDKTSAATVTTSVTISMRCAKIDAA